MVYNAFLKDVNSFCLFPYGEEILVRQYQFTPNSNLFHLYLTDIIEPKEGTKFKFEVLNKQDFLAKAIDVGPNILEEEYRKVILSLTEKLFLSF